MYADDLVLVSHNVCVLQMMIEICVNELNCIGLSFNVKKSCLLRFGPRYMCVCEPITLYNNKLTYVHIGKISWSYIVFRTSGKCFGVDLRSAKSNFYSSINSIFHSAASYQNELVVLHSVCLL